jgi:hypothetical protein
MRQWFSNSMPPWRFELKRKSWSGWMALAGLRLLSRILQLQWSWVIVPWREASWLLTFRCWGQMRYLVSFTRRHLLMVHREAWEGFQRWSSRFWGILWFLQLEVTTILCSGPSLRSLMWCCLVIRLIYWTGWCIRCWRVSGMWMLLWFYSRTSWLWCFTLSKTSRVLWGQPSGLPLIMKPTLHGNHLPWLVGSEAKLSR